MVEEMLVLKGVSYSSSLTVVFVTLILPSDLFIFSVLCKTVSFVGVFDVLLVFRTSHACFVDTGVISSTGMSFSGIGSVDRSQNGIAG